MLRKILSTMAVAGLLVVGPAAFASASEAAPPAPSASSDEVVRGPIGPCDVQTIKLWAVGGDYGLQNCFASTKSVRAHISSPLGEQWGPCWTLAPGQEKKGSTGSAFVRADGWGFC